MPRRSSPRYSHGHAAFILIPLFSSLGECVSLSALNNKLSNLPPACNSVYTAPISGCSTSDFANGNPCSDSCSNALQTLTPSIQQACANAQLPGNDVISAFKNGHGVQDLCPNINDQATTSSGGSAGAAATASNGQATGTANTAGSASFVSTVSFTSTLSPSASSTPSTSTAGLTTSVSSSSTFTSSFLLSSAMSTASTMTTPISSITMDTSAPPVAPSQSASLASMMSSLTSAAPPIRTSDSSDRSGGGSPFDISSARHSARAAGGVGAVVTGALLIGAILACL